MRGFEAIVDKIFQLWIRSARLKLKHILQVPVKLYPNLTAEANIIIQTKENTITIREVI
jgi:hypothetical protein